MGGFGEAVQKQGGATMDDLKASAAKMQDYNRNVVQQQSLPYDEEKIREFLFGKTGEPVKTLKTKAAFYCCLIRGKNGTGKTGILQSYQFKKPSDRMLILDLDGGNHKLLDPEYGYNKDRAQHFMVRDPVCFKPDETGEMKMDYAATLNLIKSTAFYIKQNGAKENIVAVALDGLSKLLQICEYQMRVERHVQADGGVSTRFWLLRKRMFDDIVEQFVALTRDEGIDIFFVGHDDFLDVNEEGEKVKIAGAKDTFLRVVHQIIDCSVEENPDAVLLKAHIAKNHDRFHTKGASYYFGKVNKATGEYQWNGAKVLELLKGKKPE